MNKQVYQRAVFKELSEGPVEVTRYVVNCVPSAAKGCWYVLDLTLNNRYSFQFHTYGGTQFFTDADIRDSLPDRAFKEIFMCIAGCPEIKHKYLGLYDHKHNKMCDVVYANGDILFKWN